MAAEKKIGVVIPVYNAKRYLRQCIQSVLNQTFQDFCLVLVDDGSSDGSGKICDTYAAKDSRVCGRGAGTGCGRTFGICPDGKVYLPV